MGDLLIRNVAEALKTDLDQLADRTGQSLSETVQEALREGVNLAKRRLASDADKLPLGQRLQAAFAGASLSQDKAEEFHRYLDEQRKKDTARPLPDFT